jgi:hypothetical protein
MENGSLPAGGVDLSRRGGVPVGEVQLVPAAMVDAKPEGLAQPGAVAHLVVVNMLSGVVWLVPMSDAACRNLRDQLDDLVAAHDPMEPPPTQPERST